MVWFVLVHLVGFLVDLLTATRRTEHDKDLQNLELQHQLRLVQRERPWPPRLTRWEKLTLAVLTAKLAGSTTSPRTALAQVLLLLKPETVLKWHRELIRRKWTCRRQHASGRPATPAEVEELILRLARENPTWGHSRIHGELAKLGNTLGRSTVRDVLQRHQVPPAPTRQRQPSTWRASLRLHQDQVLACDFFTVETLFLKTIYVLYFIELGTRRVHVAGCTANPTAAWVTQQARQLGWQLQDSEIAAPYLIRDRDSKFVPTFDAVFQSEGVTIIRTPYRAPNANAVTERWIRSVRQECLNHLLIVGEAHLRRVLDVYVGFYNEVRPHQGLDQRTPIPARLPAHQGPIRCRALLGGMLHSYDREAAKAGFRCQTAFPHITANKHPAY